jgi:hypothetical protein
MRKADAEEQRLKVAFRRLFQPFLALFRLVEPFGAAAIWREER